MAKPGPYSDNSWLRNSVDVLDYCPSPLNAMWSTATRVWDSVTTGIRFNYQNKQHAECEDIEWKEGAIVICSQGNSRDPEAATLIRADHHEITEARIWLFFQDYEEGDDETAVHEFGHAIGLHHFTGVDASGKPLSIMHPDLYIGRAAPLPEDLAALQAMGYMQATNPNPGRRKHRRKR